MKFDAHSSHDPVMSEFHHVRPIFYNGTDDDLEYYRCYGPCLSEEIWKKFELLPTPPLSPEHSGSVEPDSDSEVAKILRSCVLESSANVDDPVENSSSLTLNSAPFLFPKFKESEETDFEDDAKLIKDCMWNGYGHKPRSEVPRRCHNSSPMSAYHIPANGFVDPRAVFPVAEKSNQDKSLDKRRRRSDGGDCVSDSEEEIDVVTVEKGTPSTMPRTTTLGVVSQGRKYVGTLVSTQNGRHRQLALVTAAGSNRMRPARFEKADKENFDGEKVKIQSRPESTGGQQTVTMVINNVKSNDGDNKGQGVNLQLRSLPVVTTSVAANGLSTKRQFRGQTNQGQTVRLAVPANVTRVNGSKRLREDSPNAAATHGGKRPHLSLEGVSMVSNTGIMKHRSELSNSLNALRKSEPRSLQTVGDRVYVVTSTAGGLNAIVPQSEKKKTKKVVRSKVAIPFDSPTGSPASLPGDTAPLSPKKHRPTGADSNSSGSDEEIRAAHNVLERQRREGLRTSFNNLRLEVPDLVDQERAPKVLILKKAKEYCSALQEEETKLQAEKARLLAKNSRLQKQLRESTDEYSAVPPVSYASPVKNERIEVVRIQPPSVHAADAASPYYCQAGVLTYNSGEVRESTERLSDDEDDFSSGSDDEYGMVPASLLETTSEIGVQNCF